MELLCEMDDNLVESLWVRVKGEGSKDNAVLALCYSLSLLGEAVDEAW